MLQINYFLYCSLMIHCLSKAAIYMILLQLNNELNSLNVWLGANKLSINVSKIHYMVFHRARRKNNNHNNIFLNNSILTKVNYTQFLGIILDNKLNWINHISFIKC